VYPVVSSFGDLAFKNGAPPFFSRGTVIRGTLFLFPLLLRSLADLMVLEIGLSLSWDGKRERNLFLSSHDRPPEVTATFFFFSRATVFLPTPPFIKGATPNLTFLLPLQFR